MNDEPHTQIREMRTEIRERQGAATREARTAWSSWPEQVWERPWIGFVFTAAIPGVLLTILGPFGSYAAPLWMRALYWIPTMAMGAGLGAGLSIWTDRAAMLEGRPFLRVAVLTTAMTAAMAGVAWGMAELVFGPGSVKFTPAFVFSVWVVTLIASAISAIVRARRVAFAAAPAPSIPAGPPRLATRLPVKLRDAPILALQSEDHYVRVHTPAGSELVLMRLGDAIAEMGTTPGARAHRSWWVARTAVQSLKRADGRLALLLAGGLEVPVSRGYASELREAGWLDQGARTTT